MQASATHLLDHVFVLCAEGAPEAAALTGLGFREGSGNTHPGQGTACRRFFFEHLYLELAWVRDAAEARSADALPTRLFERWSLRESRASPFGVILRSAGPDPGEPPFPTWPYRPSYLPAGFAIDVAVGTRLSEPELFYFRQPRRPEDLAHEPRTPTQARLAVAAVTIGIPEPGPRTEALRAVEAAGFVSFKAAAQHLLEIDFGPEPRGNAADLRPGLPLVLRY
jgi:hypothetical protein